MSHSSSRLALALAALAGAGCAVEEAAVVPAQPPPARQVVLVESPAAQPPPPAQGVVVAPRGPQGGSLETWAPRHAAAAKALGSWAHDNPEAAKAIFEWDGNLPERCRALVQWAIRNRGDDITAFTSQHPDWGWFDNQAAQFHLGIDRFLEWVRQYPPAAEELVVQQRGLRWVGDHLFAAEWRP